MNDYSTHTTQLLILNRKLSDYLKSKEWDKAISTIKLMEFELDGIEGYCWEKTNKVHVTY